MSDDKATKQETAMIEPIKLLAGSHADTAQTGQGCFMNVIAYLNGEAQITDQSECVCFVMRPLAIYANDLFNDEDRQKLLPFILRAIGSRTDDRAVITERLRHVVAFAEKQSQSAAESAKSAKSAEYAKSAAKYAEYAAKSAKYAAKSAAKYAAKYAAKSAPSAAEYAAKSAKYAKYAAEYAAKYAKYAAEYAAKYAKWYETTRDDLLAMFDACFPPLTVPQKLEAQEPLKLVAPIAYAAPPAEQDNLRDAVMLLSKIIAYPNSREKNIEAARGWLQQSGLTSPLRDADTGSAK